MGTHAADLPYAVNVAKAASDFNDGGDTVLSAKSSPMPQISHTQKMQPIDLNGGGGPCTRFTPCIKQSKHR